jgi:hypothetical protein
MAAAPGTTTLRTLRASNHLEVAAGLVLGSQVRLEGANQVGYAGVGHDRAVRCAEGWHDSRLGKPQAKA